MKLQDICTVFTDGDWIESKDQSDEGIRLVQTGNIGEGKYLEKESRAKYVSEETFERLKCTEIFPGDILVSRLPEPVGRACIIPNKDERMITAVDCTICRPDERRILKEYLCYFMQSNTYYVRLLGNVTGTTRKRISRKNLGNVELNVSSIEVQREIVNRLDRLVCVIESRKKELQLLDELIKARFVELFGDAILNPNGHLKEKIEKHINLLSGYPFKSEQYVETGINICGGLIIMPQKIKWDECVHWSSAEGFEDYLLNENDIVMALDRPWISEGFKIAKVDAEHLPALLIQRTARIRSIDVNQDYLYYCFITGGFDKHSNITGSLVPHISAKDIRSFEIMIPPVELQNQFADFVKQVDKSKVAVQQALDKAQLLFDSLMQEYFE